MENRRVYIVLLVWLLVQVTEASPRTDIVARICGKKHAKNSKVYIKNFSKVTRMIRDDIRDNGYATASTGHPPNQLHLMAQCFYDLSTDDCLLCFDRCLALLPGCFPKVSGRIYLDGCFMRVDNYTFYNETLLSSDKTVCGAVDMDTAPDFISITQRVIRNVASEAPSNDGFAGGGYDGSPLCSSYAYANCWNTLDEESCKSCLRNASDSILNCLPSTEGRVANAGCFLRYSNYRFFNDPHTITAATAVICVITVLIGLCMGKIVYKVVHRHKSLKEVDIESSMLTKSSTFKYSTLEKASDNFSEANKLGFGAYGDVFKQGTLADGREIAIKRLHISHKHQMKEIQNEMKIITGVQHKNLARFLGCCLTTQLSLLIYEFAPNKSLDYLLFDPERKKELDWPKRLNIIIGTAEGLEYLHTNDGVTIVHRDIKASNILLDLRYRPKIADFGLAKFCCGDGINACPLIEGTLGYMAPEYLAHGRLTEKVDVYSYGVLVLEIVSGARNGSFQADDPLHTLVTSTWNHYQSNTVWEIVDESLKGEENIKEQVQKVVQVGLLCTQESPALRPTMTKVTCMLKGLELDIPTPSKPPFVYEFSHVVTVSPDSPHQLSNNSLSHCNPPPPPPLPPPS
uniref:Cysteine-rich receptor-like protein kinase 43 n=1 Tax=Nelumbo nucifera TaxID=4432 RepID=A0A822YHE3_NELNU|nr:TPA_asm: hypothetical protein HUJ06_009732 [Nelumbo nucifera]